MLKLIWRNWWRHKERFIIMLIGVFIISSGLSFLFSLSETNKGTVMEPLQKKWKVSYDILVRPTESNLTDPKNQLLEPNFQDGITGGITRQQLEQIKHIPDVDIAAPLAVIGYTGLSVTFPEKAKMKEFGVYRTSYTISTNNGIRNEVTKMPSYYFPNGPWSMPRKNGTDISGYGQYGVDDFQDVMTTYDDALLVGIDPEEEARLVGLDKSLVTSLDSRYFTPQDKSQIRRVEESGYDIVDVPILLSNQPFVEKTYTYNFEKLDLPFHDFEQAKKTMEMVKANGGSKYLDRVSSGTKVTYTINSEQTHDLLVKSLQSISDSSSWMVRLKATPLALLPIQSPYLERWPYTYQAQSFPLTNPFISFLFPESFRPYTEYTNKVSNNSTMTGHIISPHFIGLYDSTKLQVAKDPITDLPMDTYRSPSAKLVLDDAKHSINPPTAIRPMNNPLGLLTSPPTMLTTLEAAANIIGDKPISVIRIKVSGVLDVSEATQKKLKQVAKDIHDKTGLATDIMFDSAPQPVLIHVPASGTQPALGWIEQQWIKLGARFTMVQEVKLGFSGIILLVMLVALIYVLVTNLVSFLVRKKQFALMLSIGWRHSQIVRLMITEAVLVGAFVALVTWTMEGYFVIFGKTELSLSRFISMGLSGFFIYLLGAIVTVFFVRRISPIDALRSGEVMASARRITKVRHLVQLALAHFRGKVKRNTLSVLSITVPTTLLMFFLFVTFRLKGVFYTSWLGQYAAAEIGPSHYLAIGICLLISVLTTAEIIWQNVSERKPEISLLKAIGWRNNAIRKLILWEGFIIGCLAGVLALLLGLVVIQVLYRQFPNHDLWYLILMSIVPVFTGLIGSVLPAEMAVRIQPGRGMAGSYSTDIKSEKRLKWMLIVVISIFTFAAAASSVRIVTTQHLTASAKSNRATANPSAQPTTSPQKVGDLAGYSPQSVTDGSKASYDLSLQMSEKGVFSAKAVITASNTSLEAWDKMVFYMIPNIFTEANNVQTYRDSAGLTIKEVTLDGQHMNYSLAGDVLSVPLQQKLLPGGKAMVEVTYDFTVPEKGIRYTKQDGSYILAQWYPMLATYNHGWDKDPYTPISESYHTGFSDFILKYKLPEGYRLLSSSDHDPAGTTRSGQVDVQNVKELFVAVTKDMTPVSKMIGDVEVRVWGKETDKDQVNKAVQTAADAIDFLNKNIGPYPHKQLDVILGDLTSMEYPGVVTVGKTENIGSLDHSLVHEMIHQWFYAVVSNDPYHDGWLDEGMTELTTSLYLHDFAYAQKFYNPNGRPSNLPLSGYEGKDIIQSLYAQPVMRFKDLFDSLGGDDKGISFLHAYFTNYQYKQVNTDEFVRFTKAYFGMNDDTFFQDWLKRSKQGANK